MDDITKSMNCFQDAPWFDILYDWAFILQLQNPNSTGEKAKYDAQNLNPDHHLIQSWIMGYQPSHSSSLCLVS